MAVSLQPQDFNLIALLPEIALLVAACIVVLADAVYGKSQRVRLDRLSLLVLLLPLAALLWSASDGRSHAFGGMYVADLMAHVLKICALIATAVVIVYSRRYAADREIERGELYTLALFALLGQMVMISGSNLLVLYLGLELMSLSLYALAALRRDSIPASEAAMKYFVLGALASGLLLYGMSMLYGITGSLDLSEIDPHRAGVAILLDDTGQNVTLGRGEAPVLLFVLMFTQPLEDHLPGGGGGDPAEVGRRVVVLADLFTVLVEIRHHHGDGSELAVEHDPSPRLGAVRLQVRVQQGILERLQ